MSPSSTVTPLQRRRIALTALVDERTLMRAIRGLRIRPVSRERIRRAAAELKLEHLLPAETPERGR